MLCWLITICTIARLWIVISFEKWERGSLTETQLWELHCAFVIRLNVVNEGGSESERLGWHSRFANENEGRREEVSLNYSAGIRDSRMRTRGGGRKWVWTTRLAFAIRERERGAEEEVSLNDSAGIRDSRMRTRGGGRKWVWTTHWMIHRYRKHDWTNERTNERTTLFGELNDANWRIMKSTTNIEQTNKCYFAFPKLTCSCFVCQKLICCWFGRFS